MVAALRMLQCGSVSGTEITARAVHEVPGVEMLQCGSVSGTEITRMTARPETAEEYKAAMRLRLRDGDHWSAADI